MPTLKTTKESKNNIFANCNIDSADVSGDGNKFTNSKFGKIAMSVTQGTGNWLVDAVKSLGALGTVSYIAAFYSIKLVTEVNFETEFTKAIIFSVISVILFLFSGVIYHLRQSNENENIKIALEVLKQVYNRLAEQISTADKDKTVSITMTVDNLPEKIAEVIKKTKEQ